MARIDPKIASRFEQESNNTSAKFVASTVPLAIVIVYFLVDAYKRPSKPFYNLPAYVTDDGVIQKAADESGSLVPLMDMTYVVLSFCVFWACLTFYFLGFLRMRHALLEDYLNNGITTRGNVVYEGRFWIFGFRYYGYVSYQKPNYPDGASIRKKVRIWEPYTREMVPILYLPGYPMSGQGKDDLEYAQLLALKNRSKEVFMGRYSLLWTLICGLVPIYFIKQMAVIGEAEYYSGIKDDYDNVDKGWTVYWLFLSVGLVVFAAGGNVAAWFWRKRWLLHQGELVSGDISMHGFDDEGVSNSQSVDGDYQKM